MERPTPTMLRIGAWCVNPASGQISRDGETARVEARTMRLLLCLAEHAGEVVSIDDLLNQVWSGVIVSSGLRLPGRGIAPPSAGRRPQAAHLHRDRAAARLSDGGDGQPWADQPPRSRRIARRRAGFAAGAAEAALACRWRRGLLSLFAFLFRGKVATTITRRRRHRFAAAEIHRRAAVSRSDRRDEPGTLRRRHDRGTDRQTQQDPWPAGAAPTSSFYFKGKQIPVADIAKSLGVAYVLDGSVRKSGARLRVAARLDSRRQRLRRLV